MKWFILALLFFGCTKKYHDYDFIKKSEFALDESPVVNSSEQRPPKMRSGKKEVEVFCADQILFNRNAYDVAFNSIPALVRQSCPGCDYLLNAQVAQSWWTTLVYSKSCVTVKSFCPRK